MKILNRLIHLAILIIFLQSSLLAQHQIAQSVFANGETPTSNEDFRISGTLGQPLVGQSQNTSKTLYFGFWYQTIEIATNIEQLQDETLPQMFRLNQNYPNPFNPVTTISFELPTQVSVTLSVYNLLGRKVATLVDKELGAGRYTVAFEASGLASGVYFYRLEAGQFVNARKLTLLK